MRGRGRAHSKVMVMIGFSKSFGTSHAKELKSGRKGRLCHRKWSGFLVQGWVSRDTEPWAQLVRGRGSWEYTMTSLTKITFGEESLGVGRKNWH